MLDTKSGEVKIEDQGAMGRNEKGGPKKKKNIRTSVNAKILPLNYSAHHECAH